MAMRSIQCTVMTRGMRCGRTRGFVHTVRTSPQQVGVGHKPVAEACVMGVAMAVVKFKMERWVPGVTSSLAS